MDVQSAIIIFDEAHNVPSVAEDGSSFSFSSAQLNDADMELNRWIELILTDANILSRINSKSEEGEEVSVPLMRGMQ